MNTPDEPASTRAEETDDLEQQWAGPPASPDDHPAIRAVETIADPGERAARAGQLINLHQQVNSELARIRRVAIEAMRDKGMTTSGIAQRIDTTPGRVSQLLKRGPRPERVLLGTGELAVALGGKTEGNKSKPGPAISQDDFIAYEYLRACANELGLETKHEVIAPPGMINLNRANLVVICGPRLSPIVGQVLERDPNLGFAKDEHWHLVEHETGRELRSPSDTAETSEDYAYLGRLPRLDGKGTFLYAAGVHAPGCAGAIHYLVHNLEEIYQQVGARSCWSVAVHCAYDPETRHITASAPATEIRRWR